MGIIVVTAVLAILILMVKISMLQADKFSLEQERDELNGLLLEAEDALRDAAYRARVEEIRKAYVARRLKDCDPETILREIEDHNADN